MNWLELFAGGGGVATGLSAGGHHISCAIEMEPAIAACYAANHPHTPLLISDVREVSISALPSEIDALWASPVCKSDSLARQKGASPREDASIGQAIIPYIHRIHPALFILENVEQYQKNPAFVAIIQCLIKEHYCIDYRVLDFANYGVPQSRKRLILQARYGPIVWPEYAPRSTWWSALADLFETMEPSTLANWQQALWLPEHKAMCPLMISGHYAFRDKKKPHKRLDIVRTHQPARTVTSSHNNTHRRIVLSDGRVLRMTPRENARLQTFPDFYVWPESVELASEIIGNAVPPLMVQKLTENYVSHTMEHVA